VKDLNFYSALKPFSLNFYLRTFVFTLRYHGHGSLLESASYSAKPILHSAKNLSSATLGKKHSPKKITAKISLLSVFFWALGKGFAECQVNTRQRKVAVMAMGDSDGGFAEWRDLGPRQSHNLCQMS
jgi:hypothetical protein